MPKAHERVEREMTSQGMPCHHCESHIAPAPGDWDVEIFVFYRKVFCSESCALEWLDSVLVDRTFEACRICNEHEPVYAGVCLDCVNEERIARSLPLAAACVVCACLFFPMHGEGCCSDPCIQEARRELSHRRRARELDAFVADVNRHEVFERDDYTCQLCDLPIDMSLIFPHRMFPTLDHIIPLAAGGTHEPGNVQAAHFGCNSAKGARV